VVLKHKKFTPCLREPLQLTIINPCLKKITQAILYNLKTSEKTFIRPPSRNLSHYRLANQFKWLASRLISASRYNGWLAVKFVKWLTH